MKKALTFFAFFWMAFSASAQHDVALEKTVDMDSVAIGDIVTFSIHLTNENATNVTGLQVRDTLIPGLFYLDHIAPTGTTYDSGTGMWMVNSALDASTSQLTLDIRVQVLSEGMFMNIAEVIEMDGTDDDSEPDNNELLEDDMDKACVSVPVTICTELGDMVRVTLLPMFTGIQWYKDGVVVPAVQGGNQDTFFISSAGIYSFTALENGCPTRTCCPVVVKDSCYDLALKKVLAISQDNIVPVGAEVDFMLELTNQGDLAANSVTLLDNVDISIFAPFNETDNPNGTTGGDAALAYTWSAVGDDGQVQVEGGLLPGQTVTIPVTLTVAFAGQADNYAEIFIDDNRDVDSQPESQEQDENADVLVDDEIDNLDGDEDDHDVASLTVLESVLGDFVWFDNDRNGQQDTNEPGVPDVIVRLYDSGDNLIGTDTTDADGEYLFDNLPPGSYYVIFDIGTLPSNYNPTVSNNGDDATDSDGDFTGRTQTVTLGMGDEDLDLDFGIEPDLASVGDFVWFDTDGNGQQDGGGTGVPDVIVNLYDSDNNFIGNDTTDANGHYEITGLDPGDYYVVFDVGTLPTGYSPTTANSGDDATDSDGDVTGTTGTFSLSPGEQKTDIDFGLDPDEASMGDFVWFDEDGNGQQGPGEMGVSGVIVNLYDDEGNLVATDTTDANGEYGFTGLEPGDYFIIFDPMTFPLGYTPTMPNNGNDVSDSDADDMGTTGTFTLNAGENDTNIDLGLAPESASVGDFVWNDADHDGQQDAGEAGVSDVIVYLYDDNDNLIATDTTGSDGSYLFDGLDPGDYYVVFDVGTIPANFSPTTANMGDDLTDSDGDASGKTPTFTLSPGEHRPDIDFGIESDAASVGDFVWYDTDHNGQQDSGETGVLDVIVYLFDANDNLIATDTTDANGGYLFTGLDPDDYYVVFDVGTIPTNYTPTTANSGDDLTDSDGDATGATGTFSLSAGEQKTDIDFGVEPDPASIGDFVWSDEDGDGQQDVDENGVADVIVQLYDGDGNLIATDTTDANGEYGFNGLNPGDYYVVFDPGTFPTGFNPTAQDNGNDATDSDADATGTTNTFTLGAGESNTTIDMGLTPEPASVGDFVWNDADHDGQQDVGEAGVSDVIVYLYDDNDNLVATDTTGSDGSYLFDGLDAGDYYVVFDVGTIPANFSPTTANAGDDLTDSDGDATGKTTTFSLAPGEHRPDIDFGIESDAASIGDFVWTDVDGNGQQDAGEPGVPDVIVRLYDGNDNLIATDTTDANGGYLFTGLDPDDYYVVFDVTTIPTDHAATTANSGDDATDSDGDATGTTGTFSLSAGEQKTDVDFGIEPDPASVGDFVWFDGDGNGQQDVGENGVPDIIVHLYDGDGNLVASDTTDANGEYGFTGLDVGDYYVVFDVGTLPTGYAPTTSNNGDAATDSDGDATGTTATFSLSAGENNTTIDFGIDPDPASVGDFVWFDDDMNGQQDAGELGVADVTVRLYDENDDLIGTDTTDADGLYLFTDLQHGDYYVVFDVGTLPMGYSPTTANNGDDATDSDADATGTTGTFTLMPGEDRTDIDFGLDPDQASVGDFVWTDTNGNGQQDPGEMGVAGVIVHLYDNGDNLIASDTTDANGGYGFTGVEPGDYFIQFETGTFPTGYNPSPANVGSDVSDSDADNAGTTGTFTLSPGDNNTTIDMGLTPEPASVGDFVWNDSDHDGQQDAGEAGVSDVIVYLYDNNDNLIATDTTGSDGSYLFDSLDAGDYYVVFDVATIPTNFSPTTANMGDDLTDSDGDATGTTGVFTLSPGEHRPDIDFGIESDAASVGDFVWYDTDHNGQQDSGETGVLDVIVYLFDSNDNLIATDTTDANGGYLFTGLDPDDYYVVFDVGTLPANYSPTTANTGDDMTDSDGDATGTTGTFTLSAGEQKTDIDFGIDPDPASVGDFVWLDEDGNGQQDVGEMGVPNVIVHLYDGDGNLVASDTTDANGEYGFTGIGPGDYFIQFETGTFPTGYNPTTANNGDDATDSDADDMGTTGTFTLSPGESNTTVDMGLTPVPASVGDFVWNDSDHDGQQDAGEAGVSGIIVYLYDTDDNLIATDTTGSDGSYLFDGLDSGDYYIVFDVATIPTNFSPTTANTGDDLTDSDGDATTGTTANFHLSPGEHRPDIDFGIETDAASIGDFVWIDEDGNGQQDTGEAGVPDVVVFLYDAGGNLIASDTTDANGGYLFTGLDPDDYYVVFDVSTIPVNHSPTTANSGDDATDSDGDATGTTATFSLSAGEQKTDVDFGLDPAPASVGNFVWIDEDGNGQQDAGETGVAGVIVHLYDNDGNLIGTDTTDANGEYGFTGLDVGDYYVVFDIATLPTGYAPTTPNNGNDATDSDGDATGTTGTFSLSAGENNTTIDYGIVPEPASVGDFVWVDSNMNGQQDVGEPGVPDVIVHLYDSGGNLIVTDTTDADGLYEFTGLDAGDYYIVFETGTLPTGHFPTTPNSGNDAFDSDADATGTTGTFTLSPGEYNNTIDFGAAPEAASVGDFVWIDADGNGQQDTGESGVSGVIVYLYDADDNLIGTDTTDADGLYLFDGLDAGDYYVVFDVGTLPTGFSATTANSGNDATDSDGDATGTTGIFSLAIGQDRTDIDFGIESDAASVGNYVWNDADYDGLQGPDEMGIEGVIIYLYDTGDNLIATDTSDASGGYLFAGLDPGDYYIVFDTLTLPSMLYTPTTPNNGDDALDSDADSTGTTTVFTLSAGEHNPDIDFGAYEPMFDLALEKVLAPGQNFNVDIGDEVSYFIKVTNEGSMAAYDILIFDLIPAGLVFSPNNSSDWTLLSPDSARTMITGPLMSGQTDSIEIKMMVQYGASGATITNMAEIEGAQDAHGIFVNDVDSTPNNGNPMEDDQDEEMIELINHDPTGWIYCDKTGRIITGGTITVVGPNGIPNDEVVIINDGSTGFYEFYAVGEPGVYTLSYNHVFPMSLDCLPMNDTLDPTAMPTPITLGTDTLNSNTLSNIDCAANPFYMHFDLEAGDPPVLLNNIPVRCSYIGAIVCEDSNFNESPDDTDSPLAGTTVYLYDCADLNTPLDSVVSDAQGNYSFDGLVPGQYIVGVDVPDDTRIVTGGPIDANGFSSCINLDWGDCDSTTNICFAICPLVDAGADIVHCSPAETTQLNATIPHGSGTFSWSPTTGLDDPNVADPNANPAVTTTYTVTFDDGLGCVTMDSLTIELGCSTPYLAFTPFTDSTINCNDPIPFETPVFTDDCDNNLSVSLDSVTTPNPCGFTRVRTWTVMNNCGNNFSFDQTVNVADNIPPMATEPADTTVSCNGIPGPVTPTFTDNCDNDLTINFTQTTDSTNCGLVEITRVWQATDDCGNSLMVDQVITVVDDVAPQIVFTHPWLAGMTDGDTLTMECDNTDLFSELDAQAVDECCDASMTFVENGITPGTCATDGYIVIMHCTWVATDENGNSTSLTIHMRIEDNNPPIFTDVPGDITISCGQDVPPCATPTITDACSEPTFTTSSMDTATAVGYDRICSWMATDDCGNTSSGSYTIHVLDDPGPSITGVPGDLTVNLANGDTIPDMATIMAVDGCTNAPLPIGTFEMTSPPSGCQYTITRTWTVTDNNGDMTTLTQVITVIDEVIFTLDSTVPDTCALGLGSATFSPDTHTYSWSDGGSGHTRNDLLAGTYTVTVANGTCTDQIEITIDDNCDCQMPVLASLNLVGAGCGTFNGSATINLVGNESLYDYLWIPNFGTPNANGNGRTGLPAQRYVVFVTYQGQNDCLEKFEFEITDDCFDCPDIIDAVALVANSFASPATVCVPVPLGVSIERDIYLNGNTYAGTLAACDETAVRGFNYGNLPGNGVNGNYSVAWKRGQKAFYTVVENMDQLAAKMTLVDADGKWQNIPSEQTIVTTRLTGDLGELEILHGPTEAFQALTLQNLEVALGTEFIIPEGLNEMVINGLSDCSDTAAITVNLNQITSADPEEVGDVDISKGDSIAPVINHTVLQYDTLKTYVGQPVTADVMANDYIDGDYSCFEIVRQPDHGQVTVSEDYIVTYRPFEEFCNTGNDEPLDKFFYEICMDDGSRYTAVAFIEVECGGDVRLYPNPVDRIVNVDLSSYAGRAVGLKIFNNLGVCIETVWVGEAVTSPLQIDMEFYRAGHYTFWIQPEKGKAKVLQVVKVRF